MQLVRSASFLPLALILLGGCTSDPIFGSDGGSRVDGGAFSVDGGSGVDAHVVVDGGSPSDAGSGTDAGAPAPGAWSTMTLGGLNTHLYVPGGAGPHPVLWVLHGCSQSAQNYKDGIEWEAAADAANAIVAIADVLDGGVLIGCWDYYGASHSRSSGHAGALIAANTALEAAGLGADPARTAIAGLSSGGGMSMVMACLAPDIYENVAVLAGPTIGTSSSQIAYLATNESAATSACRSLAGANAAAFASQRAVTIAGSTDFVVAQGYAPLNASVFRSLYAEGEWASSAGDLSAAPGMSPMGSTTAWTNAGTERVLEVEVSGLGHAWPSGSVRSGGGTYINSGGLHLGQMLLEYFF